LPPDKKNQPQDFPWLAGTTVNKKTTGLEFSRGSKPDFSGFYITQQAHSAYGNCLRCKHRQSVQGGCCI